MLLAAFAAAFVALHFLLSSHPLRRTLVERLGEGRFLGLYSLLSFATFVPMVVLYDGPTETVYAPPFWGRHVNHLFSLLAFVFLVGGMSSPSPTHVHGNGQEPRAFATISRHPALWGFAFWAVGHAFVRGDRASLVLFAAMLVLALGGMVHIDRRRARTDPDSWARFAAQTSLLPFAAVIGGRVRLDWRGVLPRALGGLVIGLIIAYAHEALIGVAVFPG